MELEFSLMEDEFPLMELEFSLTELEFSRTELLSPLRALLIPTMLDLCRLMEDSFSVTALEILPSSFASRVFIFFFECPLQCHCSVSDCVFHFHQDFLPVRCEHIFHLNTVGPLILLCRIVKHQREAGGKNVLVVPLLRPLDRRLWISLLDDAVNLGSHPGFHDDRGGRDDVDLWEFPGPELEGNPLAGKAGPDLEADLGDVVFPLVQSVKLSKVKLEARLLCRVVKVLPVF